MRRVVEFSGEVPGARYYIMNGCDGIVERCDKRLSLQEFCHKDATGLDIAIDSKFRTRHLTSYSGQGQARRLSYVLT
jgi:hypothetical protein